MITGNETAMPRVKTIKQDGTLNGQQWFIGDTFSVGGLTIRQYYAGLAMQGLIANPEHRKAYKGETYLMPSEVYAEQAVSIADALIQELNKQP